MQELDESGVQENTLEGGKLHNRMYRARRVPQPYIKGEKKFNNRIQRVRKSSTTQLMSEKGNKLVRQIILRMIIIIIKSIIIIIIIIAIVIVIIRNAKYSPRIVHHTNSKKEKEKHEPNRYTITFIELN